jgi:hypothetical protein
MDRAATMTDRPADANAQPDAHPAPARQRVGLPMLWFGLFGAPAAWSVQTLVNFPVAAHGCFPRMLPLPVPVTGGLRGIVFAVSLLALAVCVAATVVALRTWRRTREEHQPSSGRGAAHAPSVAALETGEGRTRFMALSGVLTSVTFLVICLVHTSALFLVAPCGV